VEPCHIIDLPATVLDLAGVSVEGKPLVGRSLVPSFDVDDTARDRTLWWCHDGHRAVRVGDWKLVAAEGDPWALYAMAEDRAEADDLSGEHPEKVKQLEATWERMMAEFAADAGQGSTKR
jgi:arylsulfatase